MIFRVGHLWHRGRLTRRSPERAPDDLLCEIRRAIRGGDLEEAGAVLRCCGAAEDADPECLTLRGVIAECRGEWRRARCLWVRAARAGRHFAAAKRNLARYYELFTWGRCRDQAALGDELEVRP